MVGEEYQRGWSCACRHNCQAQADVALHSYWTGFTTAKSERCWGCKGGVYAALAEGSSGKARHADSGDTTAANPASTA